LKLGFNIQNESEVDKGIVVQVFKTRAQPEEGLRGLKPLPLSQIKVKNKDKISDLFDLFVFQ